MGETLIEGGASGDAVDANVVDEPAAPVAPVATPAAFGDDQFLDLAGPMVERMFQERMAPIVPLLEQLINTEGTQAPPGPLDVFSEEFAGSLDQRFERLATMLNSKIDQIAAPLEAQRQAETVAEGEQRLKDILVDDISRNGEFSTKPDVDAQARTLVRTIADQLFPQVAERYGNTPRAAEIAMTKAAETVRGLLAAERAVGGEVATNRLSTLAGAHGEPGVNGAGVTTVTDGKPLTARELALKYGGRASTLRG